MYTAWILGHVFLLRHIARVLPSPVVTWDQAPCVRLFHSTGDVGCRTPARGAVIAPMFLVETLDDIMALEQTGKENYAVTMPASMLNDTVLDMLEVSGKVAGIIVMDELAPDFAKDAGVSLSPDARTPRGDTTPTFQFDIDPSYPWNSHGGGLLMRSVNYPVVLVDSEDAQQARDWGMQNRARGVGNFPQYVAAFDYYFGGEGVNSQDCLSWLDEDGARDPQCQPIGGQSVWGALPGDSKPVVLITASLDAASFFHDRSPGANAAVSGFIAMLAAADAVAQSGLDFSSLPNRLGFAAFQAETWGFTGSRRFVSDVFGGGYECKLEVDSGTSPSGLPMCLNPLHPSTEFTKLKDATLKAVISLDQVGIVEAGSFYFHTSSGTSDTDKSSVIPACGESSGGDVTYSCSLSSVAEVPPTPLTSFLVQNPSLAGFVLSGYDAAYVDELYNSHWDGESRINSANVAQAALIAARAAITLAQGPDITLDTSALTVNITLVEDLLSCAFSNWDCPTASPYISNALINIDAGLLAGEGVSLTFADKSHPTTYTGVLAWWGGGGLPIVRTYDSDGGWVSSSAPTDPWNPAVHSIYQVPGPSEIFAREFLTEKLSIAAASGGGGEVYTGNGCHSSDDCGLCEALSADAKMVCVSSVCRCPLGHYHIALDPGLERESTPGWFTVIDASAPLWTEPNWGTIGLTAYPDSGVAIGVVATIVGTIVTGTGAVSSWLLLRSLVKQKLL